MQADEAEGWQTARGLALLLDDVPSSFSTTIRTLMTDHQKGALSHGGRFMVNRLLKGPTLKAPIFYASLRSFDEKVTRKPHISTDDLLDIFSPYDLAVLVGFLYIYKKAKRICDPDAWATLSEPLLKLQEIGMLTGAAIPAIGMANGLIGGGMRHLALSTVIIQDRAGFNAYMRHLREKNLFLDPEFEVGRWGTTSGQIGTVLLQALGAGVQLSSGFAAAFALNSPPIPDKNKLAYSINLSWLWSESLLAKQSQPEMTHDGRFYPVQESLAKLTEKARSIASMSDVDTWIEKTKDDITPELAPQLFKESASHSSDECSKDVDGVSEELQKILD